MAMQSVEEVCERVMREWVALRQDTNAYRAVRADRILRSAAQNLAEICGACRLYRRCESARWCASALHEAGLGTMAETLFPAPPPPPVARLPNRTPA